MEIQRYAIIDQSGGWIENLVMWNGNLETWQPPENTIAILASELDLSSLPQKLQESLDNENTNP